MKKLELAICLFAVAALMTGCAFRETLNQGDAAAARGEYAAALQFYNDALGRTLTAKDEPRAKIAQITAKWADELDRRAADYERAGHAGSAWLMAVKASALEPANTAYRERAMALRAAVRKSADYPVSMAAADPRARAVLGRVEQRIASDATLRRASDSEKAKAYFKLAIGEPSFQRGSEQSQRTANYRTGTRSVLNPDYRRRVDSVDALRRELATSTDEEVRLRRIYDHSDLNYKQAYEEIHRRPRPGINHWFQDLERRRDDDRYKWKQAESRREKLAQDLQSAVRQLNETPKTVSEDVMAEHRYPVTIQKLQARSKMKAAIEHVDGRPRLEADQLIETAASSEQYDAQPVAGIEAVHEAPPAAAKLEAGLPLDAVPPAVRLIEQSFEGFRDAHLRKADEAASDADRLDRLATYVMCNPRHVNSQVARRIDDAAKGLALIPSGAKLMIDSAR